MKMFLHYKSIIIVCSMHSFFKIASSNDGMSCNTTASGCRANDKGRSGRSFEESDGGLEVLSNEVLKRYRRTLNIPTPTTIIVELDWGIPISGTKGLTSFTLENDFTFDVEDLLKNKGRQNPPAPVPAPAPAPAPAPTHSYGAPKHPPKSSYASNRMETKVAEISRLDVYKHMEKFLDRKGYNGKECTLRTLCEISDSPFEHGIYGELINLVMSASLDANVVGGYDKYMTAEYYGKHYGKCGKIYPKCPQSVLDLFTSTFE